MDDIRVLYPPSQISEGVKAIVRGTVLRAEEAAGAGRPIIVMPVLNAAFMLAADFCREWHNQKGPSMSLAFIKVSSYVGKRKTTSSILGLGLDKVPENAFVIVIDTVADTGDTLRLVKAALPLTPPEMYRVLLAKEDKVNLSEIGDRLRSSIFLPGDPWLIGYGLDYNGRYRQLPYIGALANESK